MFTLLTLLLLGSVSFSNVESAQLKLIKEDQIAVAPDIHVSFLGKPRQTALGQGEYAPRLIWEREKQPMVQAKGADVFLEGIPGDARIVHYDLQGVGYVQTEYPHPEVSTSTFTWQTAGGRRQWQVTHTFMADERVSTEMEAVLLVRQDIVNASRNSLGVYAYNLRTGQLLKAFEGLKLGIGEYAFSGDSNRLIFEYKISKRRSEMTKADYIDPHVHLACMDANGQILWDVEVKSIHDISVSHHGNRVIYVTSRPHPDLERKLGRKLYPKMGLIEDGNILWEVDNPGRAKIDLLPSGEYYYSSLSADQQAVSDPTTRFC